MFGDQMKSNKEIHKLLCGIFLYMHRKKKQIVRIPNVVQNWNHHLGLIGYKIQHIWVCTIYHIKLTLTIGFE